MIQELYINGQQVDLDQSTEVVLEYKSNILGDISKIEGSHSYSITLPKTRRNLRILQDPGNPARNADTVRRYLNARYYRNGIDLFGDCRAVILSVSADGIDIALTMQGLRSLAAWSEAGKSIKELYRSESIDWRSVSAYESMLTMGEGIARLNIGASVDQVESIFYPPAISLHTLFSKIMSATGIQNYSMPGAVLQDLRQLFVPFIDIIGTRYHLQNAAHAVATGKREPARDAVHLDFSDFDVTPDPNGWNTNAEVFRVPEGSDTFLMSLYTMMPAGTFKTSGTAYFRIMGDDDNGRATELYIEPIQVNADGSALLSYVGTRTLDVAGYIRIWVEVSNTEAGVHTSDYENAYTFLFQGQKAIRDQSLLINRNLPDIKQLDLLKFICTYYGLAIVPVGIDGLSFVPYSVLAANKAGAVDWSDKLIGENTESQRGTVGFALSDFAQVNTISWTEDDGLGYTPLKGTLNVEDSTLADSKELVKLPFAASYRDNYPIFSAEYDDEEETYDVTVNSLKPRIFRLLDQDGSAALFFTGDLALPSRIQEYYKEYQDIIRQPITQTVNCRLDERDLKNLDFTRPVYFQQFGQYYAVESVRTSNNTDICEIRIIQI